MASGSGKLSKHVAFTDALLGVKRDWIPFFQSWFAVCGTAEAAIIAVSKSDPKKKKAYSFYIVSNCLGES